MTDPYYVPAVKPSPPQKNIMAHLEINDAFELPHGIGLKHVSRVWGEPGTLPEQDVTFHWFSPTDPDFERAKQELELFRKRKSEEEA